MSSYVCPEDLVELEELYVQLDSVCLENSGHWLHAQEPEQFFESTFEFLEG